MCIVKTNIGYEKTNAHNTFTVKQFFLVALIHNHFNQDSKIDHKIATQVKLIYITC